MLSRLVASFALSVVSSILGCVDGLHVAQRHRSDFVEGRDSTLRPASAVMPEPTSWQQWGATYELSEAEGAPEIVLVHLEKSAGSYVLNELVKAAAGRIHLVTEHHSIPSDLLADTYFKIGLIREPCDYYVSEYYWGIQAPGIGGFLKYHLKFLNVSDQFYSGHGSKEQFGAWLRYISGLSETSGSTQTHRCGLLSMRVWLQSFRPSMTKSLNDEYKQRGTCEWMNELDETKHGVTRGEIGSCPCPLGNCAGFSPASYHQMCDEELSQAELPNYDCWIRTERATDDLKECVQKFKARGGKMTKDITAGEHISNANDHASCSDMFDADSKKLVETVDGAFFRRFGYSGCCEPHPGQSMP